MRFLKIYRMHMITQKPELTTIFHFGDELYETKQKMIV